MGEWLEMFCKFAITKLSIMVKIEDFFSDENSVSGLNDERYSHVEMLKRAIDAIANATY